MAAIAASNVSYTQVGKGAVTDDGKKVKIFTVAFGNGSLTYPATGIPLSSLTAQGFPNSIDKVDMFSDSAGDGYLYKYDATNNSIRIYRSPAVAGLAPLTEVTTAFTPAATSMKMEVVGF